MMRCLPQLPNVAATADQSITCPGSKVLHDGRNVLLADNEVDFRC